MPILALSISQTPDAAQARRIAVLLTDLTREHLKKDPTVTAVAINPIDPLHWFCGGVSLAEQQLASFWLDIKVVDGTNTKSELSSYLKSVFAALSGILGPTHPESYILVHEVPAAAYGFGGKTQEYRSIAREIATAQQ